MENKRQIYLLLSARVIREVSFGFIAIALPLYWHDINLSAVDVGVIFTAALLGSALISLSVGSKVDTVGRKRLLVISTILWCVSAPIFLLTNNLLVVALVAILASISPTGKEVGLYLGVEQASLSRLVSGHSRTQIYAWFNFVGYVSTACGALLVLFIGLSIDGTNSGRITSTDFRWIIALYTLAGLLQLIIYGQLSPQIEQRSSVDAPSVSYKPRPEVRKLVSTFTWLFTLDAFSGGLIVQGLLVYYFRIRFHLDLTQLGALFFGTNLLSAASSLVAARLSKIIGLLNTMVFTHLPSNVLLILVPLMPSAPLAVTVLLVRHMLSQMDVPTRQAYTMAMVDTQDRGYLASWTNGARSLGSGSSPLLAGVLLSSLPLISLPFYLAGGMKIIYDLSIYHIFRKQPVPFTDTK